MANWVSCKLWLDGCDEDVAMDFWHFAKACGYRFDEYAFSDRSVYAHWFSKVAPAFDGVGEFAQSRPFICITGRWWVEVNLDAGVQQWCQGKLFHTGSGYAHLDDGALDPRPWPDPSTRTR